MSRKGAEVVGARSSKRKRGGDGSNGKRNDHTGGAGGRKRKDRGVLRFFDDAADEAKDSDTGDECDDTNDFMEEDFAAEPKMNSGPAGISSLPVFPKEELMDEEEFDRMMEQRYKHGAGFVTFADDYEDKLVEIPSAKDPTIWKVKCMAGREWHSAFCLMQKFVHLKSLGNELKIISAFAMDHVKGFIFIEAEKQGDINEACNGLPNIYFIRVQLVPLNEVSRLLNTPSKCNKISEGMWARVKNGRYKGDLAQVFAINDTRRRATVKLIPRIDLQALAAKFGGGLNLQKNASPTPRLISSADLEKFRPLIQYRRDQDTGKYFEVLDGMMLKDGYLYKKVSVDSLNFWGVEPNQEELLKFASPENDNTDDLEWLSQLYGEQKKKRFMKNDKRAEKGEGTSGSTAGNGYEMHDLVCFNRKDFGVIICLEKDDCYKILKDSSDGPVAVSVQQRDVKCGLVDLKLSALDKHGKTILIDDTVKITEGVMEGKQGIVKKIYKGVVFLNDETEVENGGYLCCKSHVCEKIALSVGVLSGKDDYPGPSCFDNFPVVPNSPPPKEQTQASENNRQLNNRDQDGPFSIGQTMRIKVGPLKGYLCRVLAIRRTGITVKLDSKQKVLTVQSEHLVEVQAKGISVSGSGNCLQDSVQQLGLFGSEAGSGEGWNTEGTNKCNTGTEANDSGKGEEENPWSVKSAPNQNHWRSTVDVNNDTGSVADQDNGLGKGLENWNTVPATKVIESGSSSWERSGDMTGSSKSAGDNWGKSQTDRPTAGRTSNSLDQKNSTDGNHQNSEWGKKADDVDNSLSSGWNKSGQNKKSAENSAWGKKADDLDNRLSSGWNNSGKNKKSAENDKERQVKDQGGWDSKTNNGGTENKWDFSTSVQGSSEGGNHNSSWGSLKLVTSSGEKQVGHAAEASNVAGAPWAKENSGPSEDILKKASRQWGQQSPFGEKQDRNDCWNSGKNTPGSVSGSGQSTGWGKDESVAGNMNFDNSNWNSLSARGNVDSNSNRTTWTSVSDDKQNANWGTKTNWQSRDGDGGNQGGDRENGNENWASKTSDGNWSGGNGGGDDSDRGGFRGRGRGGFGGRGRSDRGGFGGRGRSERGAFRGRGRGRKVEDSNSEGWKSNNDSGTWGSNRNDSGKDISTGWNKGEGGDSEGWRNNDGSGNWGSNKNDFGKESSSGWNKGEGGSSERWQSNDGSGTWGSNKNDFGKDTSSGWNKGEGANSGGWTSKTGSGTWVTHDGSGTSGRNKNDFGNDKSFGWNKGEGANSGEWAGKTGSGTWGSNRNDCGKDTTSGWNKEKVTSEGLTNNNDSGICGSKRNEFGKDTSSGWNKGGGGNPEEWISNKGSWESNKNGEGTNSEGWTGKNGSGTWASNRNDFGKDTSSGWNKRGGINDGSGTWNKGSERGGFRGRGGSERGTFRGRGRGRRDQSGEWNSRNDFGKNASFGWNKGEGSNSDGWASNNGSGSWGTKGEADNSDGWKSNDGSGTWVSNKNDFGKDTSGWNKGEGGNSDGAKNNDGSGTWNKGSERGGFGGTVGSERGAFRGRGRGRRDQSGEWNNRTDFGKDISSGWNKGEGSNSDGWASNNGSGTWGSKGEAGNSDGWKSNDGSGTWGSNKNDFGKDTSSGLNRGEGSNSEGWMGNNGSRTWGSNKNDFSKDTSGWNKGGGGNSDERISNNGSGTWGSNRNDFSKDTSFGWNKEEGGNSEGTKSNDGSGTWNKGSERGGFGGRRGSDRGAFRGRGRGRRDQSGDWNDTNDFGKDTSSGWNKGEDSNSNGWTSNNGLGPWNQGSERGGFGGRGGSERGAFRGRGRGRRDQSGDWGNKNDFGLDTSFGHNKGEVGNSESWTSWKKSGVTKKIEGFNTEDGWGKAPSSISSSWDRDTEGSGWCKGSGVTENVNGSNDGDCWGKAPSSSTTGGWDTKGSSSKEFSVTEEIKGSNAEGLWGKAPSSTATRDGDTEVSGWNKGSGWTDNIKGSTDEGCWGKASNSITNGGWDNKSSLLNKEFGMTEEAEVSNTEGCWEKAPSSSTSGCWDTYSSLLNKEPGMTEEAKGSNTKGCWGKAPSSSTAGCCDTNSSLLNKDSGVTEEAKGSNIEGGWGKAPSLSTNVDWDTNSPLLNKDSAVIEEVKGSNIESGCGKVPSVSTSGGWDTNSSLLNEESGVTEEAKGSNIECCWGKAPSLSTSGGCDTRSLSLNKEFSVTVETTESNVEGCWGKAPSSTSTRSENTEVSGWNEGSGLTENVKGSTDEGCWGKAPSSNATGGWDTKRSLLNKESGVTEEAKGSNTEGCCGKAPTSSTNVDWDTNSPGLYKELSLTEKAKASNPEGCCGQAPSSSVASGWDTKSSGQNEGSGVTDEAEGFNAEGCWGTAPSSSITEGWASKSSELDKGTGKIEEAKGSNAEGGFEQEPLSGATIADWDTQGSGWNEESNSTEKHEGSNDEIGLEKGPNSSADVGDPGTQGSGWNKESGFGNGVNVDQSNTVETFASAWNQPEGTIE